MQSSRSKGGKCVLFNAKSHALTFGEMEEIHNMHTIKISNMRLVFLPANVTSKVQSLDQGIIAAAKARYKSKLLRWLLSEFHSNPSKDMSKVYPNVMQAIIWMEEAWRELSPQTARNCWIKSGILPVGWAERLKHGSDVEVERRHIENEVQTLIQSLPLGQDALTAKSTLTWLVRI